MGKIALINNAQDCCGCGACMTICPRQAITMETDSYGCYYPQINSDRCVECGKCVQICAYRQQIPEVTPRKEFAAMGKNRNTVEKSASGGIFATLAQCAVKDGYQIAGAVMDVDGAGVSVCHILSEKEADILRMQGSKYVHSEAWRCYADIQHSLNAGKKVLFSGTPCQIMAVKQLTGNPDHLITMDLICHGVPPLKMLNDYLKILGGYLHGKISAFVFRDKTINKGFCARIETDQGRHFHFLRHHDLSFYKLFLEAAIFRENCYSCPYATTSRISDLTVGDFWGFEKYHGKDLESGAIPRRKDWSCIIVNTKKGDAFLQEYQDALYLIPSRLQWIAEQNQQLRTPIEKPEKREEILNRYARSGYKGVEADFVAKNGGKLRFRLRLLRNLFRNRKAAASNGE